MKNKLKLLISSVSLIVSLDMNVKAQKLESKDGVVISYNHRREMSAEDFFQERMKVSKNYKIAGRKFDIFFEKNNFLFCGKDLSAGKDIKLDTLYTVSRDQLLSKFPDYHLEGYKVRNAIYDYLQKNNSGNNIHGSKNNFVYKIDKNILTVEYEQISHRYIVKKSVMYYFKLDTKDLKILEFKKL